MARLMKNMKPSSRITVAIVLVVLGVIGLTNSVHATAKVVYGVLIAGGLVLLLTSISRRPAN